MNEPIFIHESDDLKLFKSYKHEELCKKNHPNHINTAFNILKILLHKRYGISYSVETFVKDVNSRHEESDIFSKNLIDTFKNSTWSQNTKKTIFYVLKNVLKSIAISPNFINRLTINSIENVTDKYHPSFVLTKKYYNLPNDNPVKILLLSWVNIVRIKSGNKSPNSIKSIISFFINSCIEHMNLSLTNWNIENVIIDQYIVQKICKVIKHFKWLKLFCEHILKIDFKFTSDFLNNSDVNVFNDETYFSGDKHTLSTEELEIIYSQTQKLETFDRLFFMLLITTGMRVGGLVKIKINHVCSIKENNINVFNQGRTLEKGNKWFEFVINPEVQDLIKKWVFESRKSNSDYLFPSTTTKSGHMAANTIRARFKKICDKCGISGKHLHLHSLRHSYAHILLKCGNNISVISKLLNHSDTQTTEKFYLKENISEIVDRAKIPWLNPDNKPNETIVPFFLNNGRNAPANKERRTKRLDMVNSMLGKIN